MGEVGGLNFFIRHVWEEREGLVAFSFQITGEKKKSSQVFQGEHNINRNIMRIGAEKRLC